MKTGRRTARNGETEERHARRDGKRQAGRNGASSNAIAHGQAEKRDTMTRRRAKRKARRTNGIARDAGTTRRTRYTAERKTSGEQDETAPVSNTITNGQTRKAKRNDKTQDGTQGDTQNETQVGMARDEKRDDRYETQSETAYRKTKRDERRAKRNGAYILNAPRGAP